jgi:hypothetical protein
MIKVNKSGFLPVISLLCRSHVVKCSSEKRAGKWNGKDLALDQEWREIEE